MVPEMPALGHLAVGLGAARALRAPASVRTAAWTALLVALAYLPDADVLAFRLGIPYRAPWGHRGAAHSLGFAVLCGVLLALLAALARIPPLRLALVGAAVIASHGLLDTLTDGGLGIALLWPFSNARFFAPVRPIPVAPIGAGMLSPRGLEVVAVEFLLFLPVFVYALWPRRRTGAP
jgi:inner membrane protein